MSCKIINLRCNQFQHKRLESDSSLWIKKVTYIDLRCTVRWIDRIIDRFRFIVWFYLYSLTNLSSRPYQEMKWNRKRKGKWTSQNRKRGFLGGVGFKWMTETNEMNEYERVFLYSFFIYCSLFHFLFFSSTPPSIIYHPSINLSKTLRTHYNLCISHQSISFLSGNHPSLLFFSLFFSPFSFSFNVWLTNLRWKLINILSPFFSPFRHPMLINPLFSLQLLSIST